MNVTSFRMLDPRLLGEHWENFEGTSSFGVFWRATRLNHLHRRDMRGCLHLSLRTGDDAFARLTRSERQQAALRFTFPDAQFLEKSYWRAEEWWPFGGPVPFERIPWRLRVCPVCARSSYHCLLFQMPGVHRCPWHDVPLIDACPKCDRPLSVDVEQDLPVGRCRCGHDLVDYVATVEGEGAVLERRHEAIRQHLQQAASRRQRTWLVAPEEGDDRAWKALHWLDNGGAPSEGLLSERVALDSSLHLVLGRVGPRSGLESLQPTLAALPGEWSCAFQRIGAELLTLVPRDQLQQVSCPAGELRRAFGQLPAYPGSRDLYLSTEILDRSVLRCAAQLAAVVASPAGPRTLVSPALKQRIQQHPHGLRLTDALLRRVMTRGYADGLRVALGRHVPALYDDGNRRPVRRLPWVLLELPEGELPSARIGWTRQRGTF